jgi:chemotaxis protein methyltransferase CheR
LKTTDKEFFRITNYIRKNFGVNLMSKRSLVEKRLGEVLATYRFNCYDELMDAVEKDTGDKYNNVLISALVTNHTFFMRESAHFEILNQIILPNLYRKGKSQDGIRIWSAAASSGQEAYSVQMILEDFFEDKTEEWKREVLGTDISDVMLHKAISGEYTSEEIEAVPETWRRKYFTRKINGGYKINDYMKNNVKFEKLNLAAPFHFKQTFHVIFLRNVLIYFDSGLIDEVVDNIANYLETGGYLFIGLTEMVDIHSAKLKCIQPSVFKRI